MISQRARIVNVASLRRAAGSAGQANYAAAKAGVVALTHAGQEVARIGITVHVVCPGFVDTEPSGRDGEERQRAQCAFPCALWPAEEVAAAIRFLAGTEAS